MKKVLISHILYVYSGDTNLTSETKQPVTKDPRRPLGDPITMNSTERNAKP